MNIQELCWLLIDFSPSIETGEEFVVWCNSKNIDIKNQDNQTIINEFKLFVKSRINKILKIKDV